MMKPFDTHAHLYDGAFDKDREAVLQAISQRLSYVVCPSEDRETSEQSVQLAKSHSQVYAAVGIHPHRTKFVTEEDWLRICHMAEKDEKVIAIGETGLDYHYMYSDKETQQRWFIRQIDLGSRLDLPIIIHDREAHGDTLRLLKEHRSEKMRGIFHCFSGSREFAEEVMRLGFYISFAGSLVFPQSRRLKEVARFVPLNRLLIETDSPYLTPPPHRGERNTPLNVYYVAEEVARLKSLTTEQIIECTSNNAMDIYNMGYRKKSPA